VNQFFSKRKLMEEKRKTSRVEKGLVVRFAQKSEQAPVWDSTTIKNISAEGMLFNSSRLFVKDEILLFNFTVPIYPMNPLKIEGRVVDSFLQGHGTRIQFINLSENDQKVISDYVELLLKNSKQDKI